MYKLTREHIEKGKHANSLSCPLALSIKENLDWICSVDVDGLFLYIDWDQITPMSQYRLSLKIQNWVLEFDRKHNVEPFEFEIEGNWIKMKDENVMKDKTIYPRKIGE